MSHKSLIILTNNYPYGSGEEFLHNEIPYLTCKFDKVYIIPMLKIGSMRSIISNVELVNRRNDKSNTLIDLLTGVIYSPIRLIKEVINNPDFPGDLKSVYYVIKAIGISISIKKAITSLVKQKKLNNVIIYSYWMNQSCLGGVLASKKLRIPILSRAHGYDLYKERSPRSYMPFFEFKINNINSIAAISNHGKEYLIHNGLKDANKVKVFRLGVTDKGVLKHQLMTNKEIHIISCSSIIPLKRVDLIAKTIIRLACFSSNKIRWTHIGEGSDSVKVQGIIKSNSSSNLTIHFPGYVENEHIRNYYINEKADIFINYSEYEGVPVTLMEALSCGLPVIAPNVGGVSELIDNRVGLLVKPNLSEQELAQEMDLFIRNADFKFLSLNARSRWEEFANAEKNYNEFATFLSSL